MDKRKVLIIHHLERIWKDGYSMFGTSFETELEKVLRHLKRAKYDRIILTQFEPVRNLWDDPDFWELAEYIDQHHEYGYGWDEYCFKSSKLDDSIMEKLDSGEIIELEYEKICKGGNHSAILIVPKWIEELNGWDISLCGAFRHECLEDMTTLLSTLGYSYKLVEKLIVG